MTRFTLAALAFGGGLWLAARALARAEYGRAQGPVNFNKASMDELLTLEGVDRTMAERIVEFRPYHSRIDLIARRVLPDDVYRGIRRTLTA